MTRDLISSAAAAIAGTLALAACNVEPETVGPKDNDPQKDALAKAQPVKALPPAIRESKTYRCRDNSIIYVSFMTDGLSAAVRDRREEPPIATLRASAPGQPFTAEGYSLSGSGQTVTYNSPDKGSQTCRA